MNKDKHIPQGYKGSPLGIIPKEWEVKRLGDYVDIISGESPSLYDLRTTGTYPYVKVEDMNNCTKYQIESREYSNSQRNIVPKGSIIFPKRGAAILNNKVRIAYQDILMDSNMMAITPKTQGVDSEFLYYTIIKEQLYKIADTSTIPQINNKHILPYRFCFPPIEQQKKICSVLQLWDTAIEKQSELIDKLKLRKRALMQQLLTGKKRLPGFNGEWKKRTYSNILIEVKRSLKWDENELYKLISVRRRSEGLFFRESLYGRDIATKNLRPAKTGDFLISKMQIVHGASGLVTNEFDDAKISGSYISLVSKDSNILDIRYYNLWSQMPIFYHQTFVSSFGVHIEKMTFDLDTFMSFGMPLPPIEEQHAIVSLIESVNKEIKLANEKLTNYQSQKRGLMQQLLTGKKRTINIE